MISGGSFSKLEKRLTQCKQDLDKKDRLLTKLSSEVNLGYHNARNQFIQPLRFKGGEVKSLQVNLQDTIRTGNELTTNHSDLSERGLNDLIGIEKSKQKLPYMDSAELSLREKIEWAEKNLRDSLSQIVDQQQTIKQLIVDKECAIQKASEMEEKFKSLVEWMQVIITSTKSALAAQEETDFSDEAVQRLKTKIAASITLSRQNVVRIEELQSNLRAKDVQISHLKNLFAKLGCSLRRSAGTAEEPKNENNLTDLERLEDRTMHGKLDYLNLQVKEAAMQSPHLEANPPQRTLETLAESKGFRQTLADSLNRSGWICEGLEEEEILDVVRRVLVTLTSKTETCCGLQTQVTELIGRLAASERRAEQVEEECLKMRAMRSRSSPKSVGFASCTTDLEDSHGRLLQFLKQLGDRIPVDQTVFKRMSVADQRNFILNYVEKLSTPSPAKSESELAPKLHKRVQRLQDKLMSRDLKLRTWHRKVDKLEEQLMISKKNEVEAIEKHVFAEQRAAQLRKNEIEAKKLNAEVLQLRNQLKDSKDVKDRLEEKTMRVTELEEALRGLEETSQRQANQIEVLTTTLETEKAAMTRDLVQQGQRVHLNMDPNDANQSLEESNKETQELRDFRDIVGRLLGMRVNDLPEPNKDILHGVERLLMESGRNSLNKSTSLCSRSVSTRKVLHGYSARMGSAHAFSDSEPLAPERASYPMQHTEVGHARSSLRTSAPMRCPSPSLPATASCSTGHQQLSARDTRRY
ncbi:hypothetical protein TcWFU_007929 [Taenia crassiceps]|uniref:Uncharacterized protein n=1 Tax=Taenia crassiceps TaxID=6207 RepID=A0ABR4QI30_9CEST